jgi:hypothetical protein
MPRPIKNVGLLVICFGIAAGAVLVPAQTSKSAEQPFILKPAPGTSAPAKKLYDPEVEMLKTQVAELSAQVTKLKEQLAAHQQQEQQVVGALSVEIGKVKWDLYDPMGVRDLRRKILQKAFWDRIPRDAYLVYYERQP